MNRVCVQVEWWASVVFLLVTVASMGLQLVRITLSNELSFLWTPMVLTSVIVFALAMRNYPASFTSRELLDKYSLYLHYSAFAIVFCKLGVIKNYLVAFFASPFLFPFVLILNEYGLVNYSLKEVTWMVERMHFYATLRSISALLVTFGMPFVASSLVPFVVGALETIWMFNSSFQSYKFSNRSFMFFQYATVKSAVLLALPKLEEYVSEQF